MDGDARTHQCIHIYPHFTVYSRNDLSVRSGELVGACLCTLWILRFHCSFFLILFRYISHQHRITAQRFLSTYSMKIRLNLKQMKGCVFFLFFCCNHAKQEKRNKLQSIFATLRYSFVSVTGHCMSSHEIGIIGCPAAEVAKMTPRSFRAVERK
jgi:hypothetical protein